MTSAILFLFWILVYYSLILSHYEKRKINYLSSQMKEEIINRAIDNIRGLHKLKEKGFKIGKLKFKSFNFLFLIFNNSFNFIIP